MNLIQFYLTWLPKKTQHKERIFQLLASNLELPHGRTPQNVQALLLTGWLFCWESQRFHLNQTKPIVRWGRKVMYSNSPYKETI